MSRSLVFTAFFALALQSSQAQIFTRGVPASVTSPTADGRTHGVPASVLSPTPLPFGVNPPLRTGGFRVHGPMRRFGNPHGHKPVFIPVPVFYSYYTDPGYSYPSVADPSVPLPDALADPVPAQPTTDSSRPSAEKGDQALQDA
ncbi:MAG TPA: hypothetical protein VE133_12550, partial [Candidatus Sulfotelmatobacter sp.]|nr:hypothetical protein [Candidatus Sulfotelmatobacter sp.]